MLPFSFANFNILKLHDIICWSLNLYWFNSSPLSHLWDNTCRFRNNVHLLWFCSSHFHKRFFGVWWSNILFNITKWFSYILLVYIMFSFEDWCCLFFRRWWILEIRDVSIGSTLVWGSLLAKFRRLHQAIYLFCTGLPISFLILFVTYWSWFLVNNWPIHSRIFMYQVLLEVL